MLHNVAHHVVFKKLHNLLFRHLHDVILQYVGLALWDAAVVRRWVIRALSILAHAHTILNMPNIRHGIIL